MYRTGGSYITNFPYLRGGLIKRYTVYGYFTHFTYLLSKLLVSAPIY